MTEQMSDEAVQALRLHHMESSIEVLNARIARLAIGLGISLKNDFEMAHVMLRQQVPDGLTERRLTPDRREATRADAGPDRRVSTHLYSTSDVRVARQLEELRGLLVLRYSMETSYVDEVGVTATREILVEAEMHLMRDGFEPGADGIDLNRLLDQT